MSVACGQLRQIGKDYRTCVLVRPHGEPHADGDGWHWIDGRKLAWWVNEEPG